MDSAAVNQARGSRRKSRFRKKREKNKLIKKET